MSDIIMRASDFVIFKGDKGKNGKPYHFAKVDGRCALMNSASFLEQLEKDGARIIVQQ